MHTNPGRLRTYSLGALAAMALAFAGRADSAGMGTEWTYQYLLSTSKTGYELTYVIAAYYQPEPELREPAMLDLVAETLLHNLKDYYYDPQNLTRMMRALRYSESPRYARVAEIVAASHDSKLSGNPLAWREGLIEHARVYLKEHAGTSAAQYQPGSISFAAMRESFLAPRPTPKPVSALGKRLMTLRAGKQGATFDDVISTMGPPQYVIVGRAQVRERLVGWKPARVVVGYYTRLVDLDRLQFYYRGIGRVSFEFRDSTGWRASLVIANPVLFDREMPAEAATPDGSEPPDEAPDMTLRMHEILYGGLPGVRQAIEVRSSTSFTPEVKDAAAEFLATHYASDQGAYADDTFEAICGFLAMQVDRARYGPLIRDIAARSRDRKIGRIAASIDPNAGIPAEPFKAGAVTLDEWRKRYPALYPESTFIGPVDP
jgi:hypothetical protein